jgi:Pyruvate/2-oxoacid:ferredoxin oxidoreductase gamma subunit
VTNIVALGALNQASKTVGPNTLQMVIRERVPSKFLQLNLEAFGAGVALVADAPETARATPTVSQAAAPAVVN